MPSKTFLFNRGIFVQTIRNVGWASLLYFVLLFFSLPLQLLMKYTQERDPFEQLPLNLFSVMGDLQVIFVFTVPVLLAIFLFRYMHVKLSADFMHGLPVKREQLFHQQVGVGAALLILPIVLITLLSAILIPFLNIQDIFSTEDVVKWFFTVTLMTLLVYTSSIFVSVFTGMSILHGLLTYILLAFPVGITIMVIMNLRYFLNGLAVDYYFNGSFVENLFLPARYMELTNDRLLTTTEMVIYSFLILFFYVMALLMYLKRNVEVANSAIAFKPLQPIFKYGVTFCVAIVGGLYFQEVQYSFNWGVFGYIAGALLGYVIAQMILDKTWRIFSKWKGYVGFLVAFGLLGFILQADVTGFERKVPEVEDVEKVYFAEDFYPLFVSPENFEDDQAYNEYKPFYYRETENIEHIIAFHKQVAKEQHAYVRQDWKHARSVAILYELKNGKQITRQYIVPAKEYKLFYEPIVSSDEHMENYHELLRDQNLDDVEQLILRSHDGQEKQVTIADPQQVREFLKVIEKDMRTQSFDDLYRYPGQEPWGDIELIRPDKKALSHVSWNKSYEGVDQWLAKQNLLEKARSTGKDYDQVIIVENDFNKSIDELKQKEIEKAPHALKVTDASQIDVMLKASIWDDRGEYVVAFYHNKQKYPVIRSFRSDKIPDFVKQHFNNK
ncbi:DUF6449 domain-containing protein [Metabacillus iocasae]|uniref:ABC-2 type transport system permease protein n=1 Tax=Priestia iocasae TaxID=2291674 RepID=A0ABS2QW84_9BACI|nr:ABC transporter permease [Metabacillus iocasae]MBM7703682.1 ABC-2 type transport system permease protein [Metabacillus iocasae]